MKSSTSKPKRPVIVLLDAHAIIHRGYHAFSGLRSSTGEPTGALFGMLNMILSIVDTFEPYTLVAAYDRPEKTFRHDAFSGYKGTRQKSDDDLILQLETSRALCESFSIPILDAPGFEADDIIGTLSAQLQDSGYQIVIASGDRDTLQLVVDDTVVVYTLRKSMNDTILFNEEAVNSYYGFGPLLVPDYKALAGDSSDNIPGIKGIGDKTARTLISSLGSIEQMYELTVSDPEKVQSLVTPRIYNLLLEGKDDAVFSKILGTIRLDAPVIYDIPEKPWVLSVHMDSVYEACRTYEFKSLVPRFEKVFGVAKSHAKNTDGDPSVDSNVVSPTSFQERTAQIMRWVLDSRTSGATWFDICEFVHEEKPEVVIEKLFEMLEKDGLDSVYRTIEEPLLPVVTKMEERGLLVDTSVLSTIGETCSRELARLEKGIYELSGTTFNIQSPKQLSAVLFDQLKISTKGLKKNKSGGYSTAESELEKIRELHPISEYILEYRMYAKLLSTYVDLLPTFISADGRIHAKFRQDGSATGRFSSSDPNIQNIPIRSEVGRSIRTAFIAPKGYKMLRVDYSQIELRVVAMLANEVNMCNVFRNEGDIHTMVASQIFDVSPSEVTKEMRRRAKTINFGIIYGMGAHALSQDLKISRQEAVEFQEKYFATFPKLRDYFDGLIEKARKNGYVSTLFGRKRTIPEIHSTNAQLRSYAERIAMNMPIQGTAADILKLGMICCSLALAQYPNVHLIATVHDELLFEVPDDLVAVVARLVSGALMQVLRGYESLLPTVIPLLVEPEVGDSWGTTKPIAL